MDLYSMSLGDNFTVNDETVATKVPGGWIFKFWDHERQYYPPQTGVFVPFNTEFQKDE